MNIINTSYPRLYFRVWSDSGLPVSGLAAAGVSTAKYSRYVNGRWTTAVTVGTVSDGTEGTSFSAGVLIPDATDSLGNLCSLDVPTAAVAAGADAVRLVIELISETDTVDAFVHSLADATITSELAKVIKTGQPFVTSSANDTDKTVTFTRESE
tara:strand:- start:8832 stop:9293 length:462 start_codon:yes stop_codon:yes gene_type:complete